MKRKMLIILVLTFILTIVDCWHSMYLNLGAMSAIAASPCSGEEGGRIVNIRGGGVQIRRNNNPFNPFNTFGPAQVGTTLCCENELKPGGGVTVTIWCNKLNENRNLRVGNGRTVYTVYNMCLPSGPSQAGPCSRSGSGGNTPGKK
jgi:hypothetical protein